MDIFKDLYTVWARFWDSRERDPQYSVFTHEFPDFSLPVRRALPDVPPRVAILTPCKDAESDLDRYFGLIDALDYPKDKLHLRLLEGDSTDATYARAADMLAARPAHYASSDLIKLDLDLALRRDRRTQKGVQRERRAGIAACRNRLLQAGLETNARFFLFIDVDMAVIPPETLKRALEWDAPILVANCLRFDEEKIFDRNSFLYTRPVSDRMARRFVRDGIYQPPTGFFRHYPAQDSPHGIEPLHAVGGTYLLIRRDVIEAGADFPEVPYQLHIETEGFALKAAGLGFGAFMPPRLIVRHGPN
ncbi:MAG: hypothetical protein QNJ16_10345 [Rhodobacter sp.]|nr:hypothetical protein [Rhodobacter sp.]